MKGQHAWILRADCAVGRRNGGPRCREIVPRGTNGIRTGRGFTLIELLVVISIISLLVAIMVPSLTMAQELARRGMCGNNQRSIMLAAALYAQQNDSSFPYIPLNGGGWGVAIGTNRDQAPNTNSVSRAATSNLYLLARGGFCAVGMFLCPSAKEQKDDSDTDDHWDFTSGQNVSYSLMNPYGNGRYFEESGGSVVLLADGSPYFDPATGLRNGTALADLSGSPTAETVERGNSENHGGVGQNVAVFGGSTRFVKRADVGAGGDNIYTRANEADGTDAGGSLPAAAADASGETQGPAGEKDSYLIP